MGWRQRNFVLEKQQPFLLLPPPSSSLANRFLLEEAWRWRRGGGRNEEEGGIWGERRMRMGCWVESESWKGDSTKNPPFFSFFSSLSFRSDWDFQWISFFLSYPPTQGGGRDVSSSRLPPQTFFFAIGAPIFFGSYFQKGRKAESSTAVNTVVFVRCLASKVC